MDTSSSDQMVLLTEKPTHLHRISFWLSTQITFYKDWNGPRLQWVDISKQKANADCVT